MGRTTSTTTEPQLQHTRSAEILSLGLLARVPVTTSCVIVSVKVFTLFLGRGSGSVVGLKRKEKTISKIWIYQVFHDWALRVKVRCFREAPELIRVTERKYQLIRLWSARFVRFSCVGSHLKQKKFRIYLHRRVWTCLWSSARGPNKSCELSCQKVSQKIEFSRKQFSSCLQVPKRKSKRSPKKPLREEWANYANNCSLDQTKVD